MSEDLIILSSDEEDFVAPTSNKMMKIEESSPHENGQRLLMDSKENHRTENSSVSRKDSSDDPEIIEFDQDGAPKTIPVPDNSADETENGLKNVASGVPEIIEFDEDGVPIDMDGVPSDFKSTSYKSKLNVPEKSPDETEKRLKDVPLCDPTTSKNALPANSEETNGVHDDADGDLVQPRSPKRIKLTARKRVSSFTPRLTPVEVVDIDLDEEENSVHPEYENVKTSIDNYLREVATCVNQVEESKIKQKLYKRLEFIKSIKPEVHLGDELIKRIDLHTDKVIAKPGDVFEFTKKLFQILEDYKTVNILKNNNSNKVQPKVNDEEKPNLDPEVSNAEQYKEQKRKSKIKKLEKAQKKCSREIRKLEEKEMSLDDLDDEDSTYLKIDRFKKRFMTITKKIHELSRIRFSTNRKSDKKFKTEASRIPEINKRIMEMVNEELKKPRQQRHLPDYADILKIFKEVSRTHPACSTEDAQTVFQDVCKQLQNRRIADDMDELEAYLPEDLDEDDITKTTEEVKEILKENDKQAKMNMNQVLDEFAQKQTESNEQPVEVGDNEEESVKDSDESDGDFQDSTSFYHNANEDVDDNGLE